VKWRGKLRGWGNFCFLEWGNLLDCGLELECALNANCEQLEIEQNEYRNKQLQVDN
jgi:hypothetical protein